jgi:nicotinate-nucleotide adenylyltransferase
MSRLGVLGGSFDPLHLGHLWIATYAREQLDLDRVLFVPAASPPHKDPVELAPYAFRLALVRRALLEHPGFSASDLEADAGHASYTVETLRRLRAGVGSRDEIWLLLGSDSLLDLRHWREPEEIVRLARIGVYGRPGHEGESFPGARVAYLDGPACGLSSTLIRERLRAGRSVAGMVPESILALVETAAVYRKEPRDGAKVGHAG